MEKIQVHGYKSVEDYLDAHYIRRESIFGNVYMSEKACKVASIIGYKGRIIAYCESNGKLFIEGVESLNIA